MLTVPEQEGVFLLARRLATAIVRHNRMVAKGETTKRIAAGHVREAEDRLRDYLKEVG